jgi:iron complex outermembrane receptor protein
MPGLLMAQPCQLKVWGRIQDGHSLDPIAFANVYFKEAQQGAVSDANGFFEIPPLCQGSYHVSVSHIGCQTKELYLTVTHDTTLLLQLEHHSQIMDELAIAATAIQEATTQELMLIDAYAISQNTDKNMANMLDNLAGVSTLRNGNNIAKPVVNGLYGNRLILLNNGVAQSGQQWGADHSPEIDPLAADKITVIKGVSALAYQGSNLGSAILINPQKIDSEPHFHGKIRYFFESNGLGNGLNIRVQKHHQKFAWSLVGTAKKKGDSRAAAYYLTNTGAVEGDFSLQMEYTHNTALKSELFFSSFNAHLGVLRGAHIGNLTDLEEALVRSEPFYTKDQFSYQIKSPYQKINHHLLKWNTSYLLNEDHKFDFTYAAQWDLRKEFDVRRSGRSVKPAMSLNQTSYFTEIKYKGYLSSDWEVSSGVQLNRKDNYNEPGTGILPLIPDYISFETGLFVMASKKSEQFSFELGGRYDYLDQRVATISRDVVKEIKRYYNYASNMGLAGGVNYLFSNKMNISYNLGLASRNPGINERYSNGLHQGVSGIEVGNPELVNEQSLKNTLALGGKINAKILYEILYFDQSIENYIFLNPQNEFRSTIRGTFPVFKYAQTKARILGWDLTSTFLFSDRFNASFRASYLKGTDTQNNIPLIYLPSNNLFLAFKYQIPQVGQWEQMAFELQNKYVFEQKNILSDQDFVSPPKGYNLTGVKISGERQLSGNRLNIFLRIDNLFNVSYRDYLNRLRYFADDLGINVIMGLNLNF